MAHILRKSLLVVRACSTFICNATCLGLGIKNFGRPAR